MTRRVLACLLAVLMAIAGPGFSGWAAFAEEDVTVQFDAQNHRAREVRSERPAAIDKILQQLQDPRLREKMSKGQIDQYANVLTRYQKTIQEGGSPDVADALDKLSRDLDDPNKDAQLTLADAFDQLSAFTRHADEASTYVDVVDKSETGQQLAVRNMITGQTMFNQRSEQLEPFKSRRTVFRDDANTGRRVVDAVVEVTEKGAQPEQRVVYNRKLHMFLRNIRKLYFDQCQLVRKINNGDQPPRVTETACKEPGGFHDDKMTKAAIDKMVEVYRQKQKDFLDPAKGAIFKAHDGQLRSLIDYLDELDQRVAAGKVNDLDWRDTLEAQRAAMRFYNTNQLELLQKYVIIQLSSYFSQVTNSQAKQKKDGTEMLDASLKDIGDLQKSLTAIENGDLQGYGLLMTNVLKLTKLSYEDQKYITPELMTAAGEAFAYVSFAVKAKAHAFTQGISGEEQDAAIEESQQWLKLAQNQLQTFELGSLAIQMDRLRLAALGEHLGLTEDQAKAEAQRLADAARGDYAKHLAGIVNENKEIALKQSVAAMYLGLSNAHRGYLFADTLLEELRVLAAKSRQMRALYLAREFQKVKDTDEYRKRATAVDKLNASVYQYYLEHLPPQVAQLAGDLETFARSIEGLPSTGDTQGIQSGLGPLIKRFDELARALGFDQAPDQKAIGEQAKDLGIREARFGGAFQEFTTNMRMFDMMNELDLYVRKYASSEVVHTGTEPWWSSVFDFKFIDAATNAVTGGGRDKFAAAAMEKLPWTKEAFEKLGGKNQEIRHQILALMNQQKYRQALALLETLDPKAAERSAKEVEFDKLDKDPFEALDFDSFMSHNAEDMAASKAQGVATSLFNALQPYILGYMGTTAVFDAVVQTVGGAFMGTFGKVFLTAERITTAISGVMDAMKVARAAEEMGAFARAYNMAIDLVKSLVNFGGRTFKAWGNNFQNAAGIQDVFSLRRLVENPMLTTWNVFKESMTTGLVNSAKRTIGTMTMMGGASAGMSMTEHALRGDGSQFKSAGDAAWQGVVGGVSFGAKSTLLLHMSPIQAGAFGNGAVGRIMTSFAQSGPIDATISGAAKVIPQWAESSVARTGPLRAMAEAFSKGSPTLQFAGRWATMGYGLIDGGLKYYLAAEVPKEVGSVARFYLGDDDKGPYNGATAHVRHMAAAQNFGSDISQVSWLFVPVEAMTATSADYKNYQEQMYGFSRLKAAGELRQIEAAENNGKVEYDRSFMRRLGNFEFLDILRGRGRTGELTATPEMQELAAAERSRGGENIVDQVAVALADVEARPGVQSLESLRGMLDEARADKARKTPSKAAESAASKAEPSGLSEHAQALNDYLDKSAAPDGEEHKVVIHVDKDGNFLGMGPGGSDSHTLEYLVSDKGARPPRSDEDQSDANRAAVRDLSIKARARAGDFIEGLVAELRSDAQAKQAGQAQGADAKSGTHVEYVKVKASRPTLRDGEVFINNSSVSGRRGLIERRIASDKVLRENIISGGDSRFEKDPKTGQRVEIFTLRDAKTGQSVEISGKKLTSLRQMAERAKINERPLTVRETLRSIFFGDEGGHNPFNGRLWKVATTQNVNTREQMLVHGLQGEMRRQVKRMAKASPEERLKFLGTQLGELIKKAPAEEAQALKSLHDLAQPGADSAATIAKMKAEVRRLAGGNDPADLIKLRRIFSASSAESLTETRRVIDSLPEGQLKQRLQEEFRKAKSFDPLGPELIEEAKRTIGAMGDGPVKTRLTELMDEAAAAKDAGAKDKSFKKALKALDALGDGAPIGTLAQFDGMLDGRPTVDAMAQFAREAMSRQIERVRGTLKTAMTDLRSSLEGDALLGLVSEDASAAVDRYRGGRHKPADWDKLNESIDLYVDAWERGVFGQKFLVRVEKTKDGKTEKVWEVPEEFQFKDANGTVITSFRQHQIDAIRSDLQEIARGNHRLYDLLQTSGGKTLLGFSLAPFLNAYARKRGKQGVYYVTANADLVAQAQDAYRAFFKGRKPDFEIITYSDLMLKQAMADKGGTLGPFATHDMMGDEFDDLALKTALSLGKFNGEFRHTAADPALQALRRAVVEAGLPLAGDDPKVEAANWDKGQAAQFRKLLGHNKIDESQFDQDYARHADFRRWFDGLVDKWDKAVGRGEAAVRSGKFAGMPEVAEYLKRKDLSARELRGDLLEDHRNAFGSRVFFPVFGKVGVLEAKYGNRKNWVRKVLKSAYVASSQGPEGVRKSYMVDPQREGILSNHNDDILESLDTFERTALELRENVPVTLDFENQAITDFRRIWEAGRQEDTVMIALSGTQPDGLQPFLEELNVVTLGRGSVDESAKQPHLILHGGTKAQYEAVIANLKAHLDDASRTNPDTGKTAKNVGYVWVESVDKMALFLDMLEAAGVSRDHVSILTSPGSNFFERERNMMKYRADKNIAGLNAGTVDVVILAGQGGLRGLEAPLKKYNGGLLRFYETDSYVLTKSGKVQLDGRAGPGRRPEFLGAEFYLYDDWDTLLANRYYQQNMPKIIRAALGGRDAVVRKKLEAALAKLDMKLDAYAEHVLMTMPGYATPKKLLLDYTTYRKIREIVGPEKLAEYGKLDLLARIQFEKALLKDEKAAPILILEMRRLAETMALQSSGIYNGRRRPTEEDDEEAPAATPASGLPPARSAATPAAAAAAPTTPDSQDQPGEPEAPPSSPTPPQSGLPPFSGWTLLPA